MNKFVPYAKLSKSKQKEINSKKRKMWGRSPISSDFCSKKDYVRKKFKLTLDID